VQEDCVARRDGLTGALPTSKPSKTLPEREAIALWLENAAGDILLQRRPETGIWASLWTLPQADTEAGMRDWFAREMKGKFDAAEDLPVVVHTFSHYRLHLQPLRLRKVALRDAVRDNDDLRWVARGELATLGLPAPIRKLLGN
jgi:A/G-specific adenine glycosylase